MQEIVKIILNKWDSYVQESLNAKKPTLVDYIAAVLLAEAETEGEMGMKLVYYTILNRTRLSSEKMIDIITEPKQYSCLNDTSLTNLLEMYKDSPNWEIARRIVTAPGTDNSMGATHYYNPKKVHPDYANQNPVGDLNPCWIYLYTYKDHIFGQDRSSRYFEDKAHGKCYRDKPNTFISNQPKPYPTALNLNEVIEKVGSEYCVFSKSKTKEGNRKKLGCYPTEAGAKKRLQQVEYFKHMKEEIYKIILEEVKVELLSESLRYHSDNRIPVHKNIYRVGSNSFFELFNEARKHLKTGLYECKDDMEKYFLLETNIGQWAIHEGIKVPLDFPMTEEIHEEMLSEADYHGKKVNLGKPQRGGSKKFYVYVKCGDSIKKISFGDPNLSVKIADPERRKSFVARHKCTEKKDRCTAGYWACRIGRFPHLTGSKQRYTWW